MLFRTVFDRKGLHTTFVYNEKDSYINPDDIKYIAGRCKGVYKIMQFEAMVEKEVEVRAVSSFCSLMRVYISILMQAWPAEVHVDFTRTISCSGNCAF